MIYHTDKNLHKTGRPIGELGESSTYNAVLSGVEDVIHDIALGLRHLMFEPTKTIKDAAEGIQRLPVTVQRVLQNSPEEYVAQFVAMPADRKAHVSAQIVTMAAMMAAGGAGGAGRPVAATPSLRSSSALTARLPLASRRRH